VKEEKKKSGVADAPVPVREKGRKLNTNTGMETSLKKVGGNSQRLLCLRRE